MVFVNNRKHCIASEVTCVWASFDTNVELFGRARRKEFVWKATTGLKDREVKNKYKILLVLIMIGAHYDRDDLYIIGAVCGSRKMITSSWESPVTT